MLELERTFLAKYLPDIFQCKNKKIVDICLPKNSKHPILRLRKSGSKPKLQKITIDNDQSKQKNKPFD